MEKQPGRVATQGDIVPCLAKASDCRSSAGGPSTAAQPDTQSQTAPSTLLPSPEPAEESRRASSLGGADGTAAVEAQAATSSDTYDAAQPPGHLLSHHDPPAVKRRRVGRPAKGPRVDAEERKRVRKLKNRESAMRSLQKKADYANKLAEEEHLQREVVASRCVTLCALVEAATVDRAALAKVQVETPEQASLATIVDDCLTRCRASIAEFTESELALPPDDPKC
jgi:hypothetical protein